jgi:hypothetical protein
MTGMTLQRTGALLLILGLSSIFGLTGVATGRAQNTPPPAPAASAPEATETPPPADPPPAPAPATAPPAAGNRPTTSTPPRPQPRKPFRPSEEIHVDKAVDFPADI